MSIEEKIKKLISQKLNIELEEILPASSFIDDLGADSLDLIELIMSLEEIFNIEISDEDAEKIRTVQDILDYLSIKLL